LSPPGVSHKMTRWMVYARRRLAALLVCLVFSSLELLSSGPALHRQCQVVRGGDAVLHATGAATDPAAPKLAQASELRDEAPGQCPACTISGLFAVVPAAIPAAAAAARPRITPALGVRAVASPVVASLRGRAPPLA